MQIVGSASDCRTQRIKNTTAVQKRRDHEVQETKLSNLRGETIRRTYHIARLPLWPDKPYIFGTTVHLEVFRSMIASAQLRFTGFVYQSSDPTRPSCTWILVHNTYGDFASAKIYAEALENMFNLLHTGTIVVEWKNLVVPISIMY